MLHYTRSCRRIRAFRAKRLRRYHGVCGDAVCNFVCFGSWSCENSDARLARRNFFGKLPTMRTDNAAGRRPGAVLENYVLYIFEMYEFLHSQGHKQTLAVSRPLCLLRIVDAERS